MYLMQPKDFEMNELCVECTIRGICCNTLRDKLAIEDHLNKMIGKELCFTFIRVGKFIIINITLICKLIKHNKLYPI